MTEIIMPKMGDAMEEGTLLEWLKKEGDTVKSGEPIATIQTDKATLEMEADGSGTLAGILVRPGETVPVGIPMALLLGAGEKAPADWGKGEGRRSKVEETATPSQFVTSQAPEPSIVASTASRPVEEPASKVAATFSPISQLIAAGGSMASSLGAMVSSAPPVDGGRVKASPLARKVAAELGVDLQSVSGSGPSGRIIERDVRGAAISAPQRPAPVQARPTGSDIHSPLGGAPSKEDAFVPLNRIRQITAQVTASSKGPVPHFYVTVEVDVDRLLALKDQFEEEGAGKLSINDFVLRACALALFEMPVVNSSYQGQKLLQHGSVNIGLAVALDDGLTLPVIHNAQTMSIRQLAERSRELVAKARENRLTPNELSGSTFSISNMGMLNVDSFSAIIVPPHAAILAVSTARQVVVPAEATSPLAGEVGELGEPGGGREPGGGLPALEIRTRMSLTGSFDHRVVDGAVGAKFMNLLRDYLQNPTRLLA